MNIIITANVRRRFIQIYYYYCDKNLPEVAIRIRKYIEERMLVLEQFPRIGAIEEQLSNLGLGHRYLVEGNYKIIYRIDGENIYITDIFHASQDPSKMKP